jgi:hypothetical protein
MSPVVYVTVVYAVSAVAPSTPSKVAVGAALLLVNAPAMERELVRFTLREVPVAVIPVVPEKIEAFTPGTFAAAGAVPKAVTAVAPRTTPAT